MRVVGAGICSYFEIRHLKRHTHSPGHQEDAKYKPTVLDDSNGLDNVGKSEGNFMLTIWLSKCQENWIVFPQRSNAVS